MKFSSFCSTMLLTVLISISCVKLGLGQVETSTGDENANYSIDLIVIQEDSSSLLLDMATVEVLVEPEFGELSFDNGIVYQPDGDFVDDSFLFSIEHGFFNSPVYFMGLVAPSGHVELFYQYTVAAGSYTGVPYGDPHNKSPNGVDNGDGTVTLDTGTITITGTVVSEAGTSLDFPNGTVIISTLGPDEDWIVEVVGEGVSESHIHRGVGSWEEVKEILAAYPLGSVSALVLAGHGSGGGGVKISGQNPTDTSIGLHGHNIPSDVAATIDEVLEDNAPIYVTGCEQGSLAYVGGIQLMATAIGHPVVCNEDGVTHQGWPSSGYWGNGLWIEIAPSE